MPNAIVTSHTEQIMSLNKGFLTSQSTNELLHDNDATSQQSRANDRTPILSKMLNEVDRSGTPSPLQGALPEPLERATLPSDISIASTSRDNRKSLERDNLDQDLMNQYLKLYSGIQNAVIYTEDGVGVTPQRNATVIEGYSDNIDEVVTVATPEPIEPDLTRTSPTQRSLFDFNEFFDDVSDDDEKDDDELPQFFGEDFGGKRPRSVEQGWLP